MSERLPGIFSSGNTLRSNVSKVSCQFLSSPILSRSFCNVSETNHISDVENVFDKGIDEIREYEKYCENHPEKWEENKTETAKLIRRIVDEA